MKDLFDLKTVVRFGITVIVFICFGFMFFPFWKPILMAALFGFALVDVVNRYSSKKNREIPTIIILVGFCLALILPLLFIILKITRSISSFDKDTFTQTSIYRSVESLTYKLQHQLDVVFKSLDISPSETPKPLALLSSALNWLMAQTTTIAGNVPELILSLFVFSIALYYFLTEARSIRLSFMRMQILEREELDEIITIIKKSSYRTLIVSAVIGTLQGAIVAFGALGFGYDEFILVFIITFFVSFIPVIGAAPVAFVLALISLINGSIGSAIGLIIVAVVAGSVDNLVKPYLVSASNESTIHPVVSLLAIVGAVIVYGIPGLLLGPILMELAVRIIHVFFYKESAEA